MGTITRWAAFTCLVSTLFFGSNSLHGQGETEAPAGTEPLGYRLNAPLAPSLETKIKEALTSDSAGTALTLEDRNSELFRLFQERQRLSDLRIRSRGNTGEPRVPEPFETLLQLDESIRSADCPSRDLDEWARLCELLEECGFPALSIHARVGLWECFAKRSLPGAILEQFPTCYKDAVSQTFPLHAAHLRMRYAEALATDTTSIALEGIEHLEGALAVLSRFPNADWESYALYLLGWRLNFMLRYQDAKRIQTQCIQSSKRVGMHQRAVKARLALSLIHANMGERPPFLEHIQLAIQEATDLQEPALEARAQLNYAIGLTQLNDPEQALEIIESITFFATGEAELRVLNAKNKANRILGAPLLNPAELERLRELVYELPDVPEKRRAHTLLAENYVARNKPELALKELEVSRFYKSDGQYNSPLDCLIRGRAYTALGQFDQAEDEFWSLLAIRQSKRKNLSELTLRQRLRSQSTTRNQTGIALGCMVEAYHATQNSEFAWSALAFLNQTRALSMREARNKGLNPILPDTQKFAVASVKKFAKSLGERDWLYAFCTRSAVGICVKGETIEVWSIPSADIIQGDLADLRNSLFELSSNRAALANFYRTGVQLTGELFGNGPARWRRGDRLVTLLDSPLFEFPLEFLPLPIEAMAFTNATSIPFLFKQCAFLPVPTLRTQLHANPSETLLDSVTTVNLAGNPFAQSAKNLDAVTNELNWLRSYFGEAIRETLIPAKESALRNISHPAGGILHLAAHLHADREEGERSYLAFVGDDQHDGRLEAMEIGQLNWSYLLVFVACCDSLTGSLIPGESTLSMAWGLQASGAQYIVVSPLPVDDEMSFLWVVAFYRALATENLMSSAIRKTRLNLLQSPHPLERAAALTPYQLLVGMDGN